MQLIKFVHINGFFKGFLHNTKMDAIDRYKLYQGVMDVWHELSGSTWGERLARAQLGPRSLILMDQCAQQQDSSDTLLKINSETFLNGAASLSAFVAPGLSDAVDFMMGHGNISQLHKDIIKKISEQPEGLAGIVYKTIEVDGRDIEFFIDATGSVPFGEDGYTTGVKVYIEDPDGTADPEIDNSQRDALEAQLISQALEEIEDFAQSNGGIGFWEDQILEQLDTDCKGEFNTDLEAQNTSEKDASATKSVSNNSTSIPTPNQV